jgi:hypothetical protein
VRGTLDNSGKFPGTRQWDARFSIPDEAVTKHGALTGRPLLRDSLKHRFSIGSKVSRMGATGPQGMSRKVVHRDPDSLRA